MAVMSAIVKCEPQMNSLLESRAFCQSGARELLSRFDTGHRYIMAKSLRAAYVRPGSVVSEMKMTPPYFRAAVAEVT
jgi:hypothetical protein